MVLSWKLLCVTVVVLFTGDRIHAFSMNNRVFVSTPVSKFPKRLVSDYMDPVVHVLTPEMTVDETLQIFIRHELSAAPVVGVKNNLIGIVSSFDFFPREAFEGALLPMGGTVENVEHYVEMAKKICGQRVEDVMSFAPVSVTINAPMRDAAAIMAEKRLHRLPVLDENGTLVGMLTAADVMKDLMHVLDRLPPAKDDKSTATP